MDIVRQFINFLANCFRCKEDAVHQVRMPNVLIVSTKRGKKDKVFGKSMTLRFIKIEMHSNQRHIILSQRNVY